MGTVVVSISQMRKLTLSEAKEPVQGHATRKWQSSSRIQLVNYCSTWPLAVCEHNLSGKYEWLAWRTVVLNIFFFCNPLRKGNQFISPILTFRRGREYLFDKALENIVVARAAIINTTNWVAWTTEIHLVTILEATSPR